MRSALVLMLALYVMAGSLEYRWSVEPHDPVKEKTK